jgi:hypothetical protein
MLTFTLTEQQADQVLAALQYRPFIEVNGLIGVLMQQAQEQQAQAQYAQQQAQLQQDKQVARQLDKPFDAAESNRIGEATGNAQSAQINGLDRHA